ncbi:hypothetical protein QLX67_13470, partial [Balneolaceae bacterium ANBcel3]|nr:hypothetical protein [Balneolaceae bacterium ANBcel3]
MFFILLLITAGCQPNQDRTTTEMPRERISINDGWRFMKYDSPEDADHLIYDVRPTDEGFIDDIQADTKPTEAVQVEADRKVLKPWILPSGNAFIRNTENHHVRPPGQPGQDVPFVQADFDDSNW